MTAAEKARVLGLLPRNAEPWMAGSIEGSEEMIRKLGGEFLITGKIRRKEYPNELYFMEYHGKNRWISECKCTACRDVFYTETHKDGIILFGGEDGQYYAAIDDDKEDYMCETRFRHGETMECPMCGKRVRLIHKKQLQGGRTKQIMLMRVERLDRYAVCMMYLVSREIDQGYTVLRVRPKEAYVLGDEGEIVQYTRGLDVPQWRERKKVKEDPAKIKYANWEGEFDGLIQMSCGYWTMGPADSLIGTTGEKTGLHEYFNSYGERPIQYLRLWKEEPGVETLVKAGMTELVEDILEEEKPVNEYQELIMTGEKKPHKMVHMSKMELGLILGSGGLRKEGLRDWISYKQYGGKISADYVLCLGDEERLACLEILYRWGDDIDKVFAYMDKGQGDDVGILLDTRDMAERVYNRKLTYEELWPRHLYNAHDALSAMLSYETESHDNQKGFDQVCAMLAPTVYTDGRLMMTIPTCAGDLVREGDVLRHCVGGYANKHAGGEDVILFVRHYRRPERPYYTLNIDLSGDKPRRVQLHGYGNERHGDRKQYAHSIPKEVRAFCDYWEQQILTPYWKNYKKEQSA